MTENQVYQEDEKLADNILQLMEEIDAKVKEEINSVGGTTIKAGESVRIVPCDEFKREYYIMTSDHRYIDRVISDKLEIKEEEK